MTHRKRSCIALSCLLLLAGGAALAKEKKQAIERYRATAMSLEVGRASMMEVAIFGWSTQQDRESLKEIEHYARKADRRRLLGGGGAGTEIVQDLGFLNKKGENSQ